MSGNEAGENVRVSPCRTALFPNSFRRGVRTYQLSSKTRTLKRCRKGKNSTKKAHHNNDRTGILVQIGCDECCRYWKSNVLGNPIRAVSRIITTATIADESAAKANQPIEETRVSQARTICSETQAGTTTYSRTLTRLPPSRPRRDDCQLWLPMLSRRPARFEGSL
jgi:hypothetical protein